MIEYLILILVLFVFLIASIEDIKKREVYDYINYSFCILVIVFSIFHSIYINSFEPFKYVIFGLIIGFALGALIYYLGIWGGGDAKFLMGFSASIFYIKSFFKEPGLISNYFNNLSEVFYFLFLKFIQISHTIIIVLNIIFLTILISKMVTEKNLKELKNKSMLLLTIVLLFFAILFDFPALILTIIGFIAFTIIFFADENIFQSIYFTSIKKIKDLKLSNKIVGPIKYKNKILINKQNCDDGLTRENLQIINEKLNSQKEVLKKWIVPFSILTSLNLMFLIMKILTMQIEFYLIFGDLFKFLFYSFFIGGLLSILMLFFYYLFNFKKIKMQFTKKEKLISFFMITISTLLILVNNIFMILILIPLTFIFLKIAKKVESHMFVKKKPIDEIVLGDWIVEDIIAGKKKVYDAEEFRLGIDETQLEKIKKLSKKYKELSSIYVKDGIAFLPPLFIGFLVMLFF